MANPSVPVDLTGVPETLLWTLYYRALEARRPDAVLADPLAVSLVDRIDYPFEARLGTGSRRAQWQALRSRAFDDRVRAFLAARPGATVVALGEGLETQFWRVDEGTVRWVGVDLPEAAGLRRAVLPGHPRRSQVDASVLDEGWMLDVDPSKGVLLTAQGLLMYLPRDDVHLLLSRLAAHFPGGRMLFDGVPRWTSAVTSRVRAASAAGQPSAPGRPPAALIAPPMPWAMDEREAGVLRRLPGIAGAARVHPRRGRGPVFGWALPAAERAPLLRSLLLSVWAVRFA